MENSPSELQQYIAQQNQQLTQFPPNNAASFASLIKIFQNVHSNPNFRLNASIYPLNENVVVVIHKDKKLSDLYEVLQSTINDLLKMRNIFKGQKNIKVKEIRRGNFLLIGHYNICDILNDNEHIQVLYEIDNSNKSHNQASNRKRKPSKSKVSVKSTKKVKKQIFQKPSEISSDKQKNKISEQKESQDEKQGSSNKIKNPQNGQTEVQNEVKKKTEEPKKQTVKKSQSKPKKKAQTKNSKKETPKNPETEKQQKEDSLPKKEEVKKSDQPKKKQTKKKEPSKKPLKQNSKQEDFNFFNKDDEDEQIVDIQNDKKKEKVTPKEDEQNPLVISQDDSSIDFTSHEERTFE